MKHVLVVVLLGAISTDARAQQPQPAQQGNAPAAAVAPARSPAQPEPPTNIRFDLTIRDEGGGGPATQRTVSLVVQANHPGSVRSVGHLPASHPLAAMQGAGPGPAQHPLAIPLNVDVRGSILAGTTRIPARVTVEYQPYWAEAKTLPSSVRAQVDAVLEDGRTMLISQAVDPISDRRTMIEVTATVMK